MQKSILFLLGVLWIGYVDSARPFPLLPTITAVITRITNNTIDVLHGVTGVVQGSLNILSITINRIVDGAGTVRDKIVKLLEEFRKYMQKGIPELGIPILEPLTIDNVEVNIQSPNIGTIKGQASNVEIRHLSEFKIDYVNWDFKNRLTLNLTFPRIDVQGKYSFFGEIGKMVKVFGKGPFWLKLGNLSIGTTSQLRYNMKHSPPYYVEYMKIKVKLKKLNSKFSNLMDDDRLGDLFNEVIANVTPSALDMLWPDVEPGISRQIVRIINEKLKIFPISNTFVRLVNLFNLNQGRIDVHTEHT